MTAPTFSLHPQLERDTTPVVDLPLTRVLLSNDANYPWLILVPRLPGIVELIDLEENAQIQLTGEIARVSAALKAVTSCDKLNVAAIGNVVPQLHVHVVARYRTDIAWPKPVWGAAPAKPYDEAARAKLAASLRQALQMTSS
jgi:diadenosine tetraphosphate (Ap4A) HIT family hydrolase